MKIASALCAVAFLAAQTPATGETSMSFYDLTATTIDGAPQKLSDYKGKVLVVVNTASECGYTPQYAGLEKLYESYKDKGVLVLGFPSNDFGGQEPGTAEEIKTFCSTKYDVTFPMMEKVKTQSGEGQSEIYEVLGTRTGKLPGWNFAKYLVGKDGQTITFFDSRVKPDAKELREAIDKALAASKPAAKAAEKPKA